MSKKEYKLNPQALTVEVIKAPFRHKTYRLLRRILIWFIAASLVNFVFSYFFYTPKMYFIDRENREMVMKYEILDARIAAASRKLEEIKHRDQTVYRPLFGQDTLSIAGIYTPYPDSKYAPLATDRVYSPLTITAWRDLDALGRMIYLESVSMDELQMLSLDKERLAVSVPAVWPIDRTRWDGDMSRMGIRWHPILGGYRRHMGLDLSAPRGTEVYSTANGQVVESEWRGGYGRQIVIDHGFGYKTRYAHLSESFVQPGQEVTRGETIGLVGSTGRSSGPHIHYEVIYRGDHQNPLNYFSLDTKADELDTLLESAREVILEKDE
jgi:murein DD-endopeptidase MepM/ murein hydrolase activator NlpD